MKFIFWFKILIIKVQSHYKQNWHKNEFSIKKFHAASIKAFQLLDDENYVAESCT